MTKYYYEHLTGPILEADPSMISPDIKHVLFDIKESALDHQKKAIEEEMKKIDERVSEKEKDIAQLLTAKDQMYIFLYRRDKK